MLSTDDEEPKVVREAPVDPTTSDGDTDQDPRQELPAPRFWALALGLCLGLLLSMMDSSIVATSLFSIGTEFHELDTVNWVALAYTLCYLGFSVFFARLSDVIGRRNAFMLAYVVFFAFSMGCGFAQTMDQLIACRAFQGIGGSGLYSLTMIIFIEITPARMKQFLASLVGIVIAVGGVLGPVLGGILTEYTTWRWVFWINGPVGFVSMALFYLAWPKAEYLPDTEPRRWRELDYPGSVLLIAAAVLVVYPFQTASSSASWDRASFLAPLLTGLACWGALIAWEVLVDKRWANKIAPALPMSLMRNRFYGAAVLNTLFLGFPFILLLYAFPLRLQVVNGKSPLLAGIYLLPMLGASAFGSVLSGFINGKKDRTCETMVMASCFVALGCGLLSTLSDSVDLEAKALGFIVFIGLGFGLSAAGTTIAGNIQSSLRDHSAAQGFLSQTRILGGSLGIAASSAILGASVKSQLAGMDPRILQAFESSAGALDEAQLDAIRHVYASAFDDDMRVCAIVSCIAVILALGGWSRNRPTIQERDAMHLKEENERRRVAGLSKTRAPASSV
ncbi:hypothetical protein JX266_002658 [Neoarthrinium moseri]|nr:hypothetical protein JX266_002658 [Neoarthrinium moseri]